MKYYTKLVLFSAAQYREMRRDAGIWDEINSDDGIERIRGALVDRPSNWRMFMFANHFAYRLSRTGTPAMGFSLPFLPVRPGIANKPH